MKARIIVHHKHRHLALFVALALGMGATATACGSDEEADEPTTTESEAAATEEVAAGDLASVCPETLVLQTDWFPEAEYGAYFSLIGDGGEIDAGQGTYRGPILDTGVELEIRAGGPFIGQETVQSLMYQDDSIDLGLVHTDDAVRFSDQLPVVSVVAPLEHSPLALVWDPDEHDFETFEDIGASDASILVFTKEVNYVPFLVDRGLVPEENFDDSFDGSYSRFVADPSLVQQAFITETPFRLKNEITDYGKDVEAILISESGYDPYLSSLSVRQDKLEEMSPCLEQLVPIVQQAQVDYVADPGPGHEVMIDVVTEMDTFWTLSPELLADGTDKMLEYDIVSNGDDETLGNFDTDRVQTVIDDFQDVFGTDVDTANAEVTPDDIVTNDFIDPDISL